MTPDDGEYPTTSGREEDGVRTASVDGPGLFSIDVETHADRRLNSPKSLFGGVVTTAPDAELMANRPASEVGE